MLVLAIVLASALVLYAALARTSDPERAAAHAHKFDSARNGETSGAARALLTVAKGLSGARIVNVDEESPTYRNIRLKLASSGGLYAGSVEVFLANQLACFLGSLMVLVATLASGVTGVPGAGCIVFAIALSAWPYSRIHEAAKKRTMAVNTALPEFAEMLLMPLNSGYGILAALDFTATRLDGPVAEEVRILTESIRSRSREESAAFADAADHLGTASAASFFSVLSQAYLEGVRVVDTLTSQAEALRKAEYERLREQIKKMPNRIAIVIGIHLIPGLFILTLFPAFSTLANL